jgi:FkbM family methyltransferase
MNILNTIYRILTHPFNKKNKIKALLIFVKWQLAAYLNPYAIIYPLTQNSRIIVKKGMTGATGNIYCGLLEFADMGFLLHFLRPCDTFVDVGANIGVYTILASAEIGAKTISIEPIKQTFSLLQDNIRINNIESNVRTLNIGAGKAVGVLNFTQSLDTVNHVLAINENATNVINVEISTLDILCDDICPAILKIDVEGFETEVLAGARNLIRQSELKAIIIELNGSGMRYGFNDMEIHKELISEGFLPYSYDPFARKLIKLESFTKFNTVYIRHYDYVNNRLQGARKINVRGKEF